ncbi:MAG: hypothetical protein H6R09_1203 [Proteobacteria bacterium]|nr:hypothetical protein [Pseudomonadota bacterium]
MKPTAKPPVVACPTCGAAVPWTKESRWKPFCSERCKLIDLGQWATEKYRVPAEEQEPEDESPPSQ